MSPVLLAESGVSCRRLSCFGVLDQICDLALAQRLADLCQTGFLLLIETATQFRVRFEAQNRPVNVFQQMSPGSAFRNNVGRQPVCF